VSNSLQLLRINVGFIAHQSIGYSRVFSFNPVELRISGDLTLHNFSGAVRFSRATQGLLLEASLQAGIATECVRCLEPFILPLSTSFTELYAFSSHAGTDTELVFPENGIIDLTALVREYFLLEIPINPLCKQDCKGLCPVCGANLNHSPCGHHPETIDPRLAVLKSLINEA